MVRWMATILGCSFLVTVVVAAGYAQVRHQGGGGGCGVPGCTGVVALQPTAPGTKQSGNINIGNGIIVGNSDSIIEGAGSLGTGNIYVHSQSNLNVGAIRLGGCSAAAPCLMTQNGSSFYVIAGNSATAGQFAIDTGGVTHTAGPLLGVYNNGVLKANIDYAGSAILGGATLTTPLSEASGGSGVGALTCAAGSFLTSNGTAYSCAAAPAGAILVYGQVASNGVIVKQAGAPAVSVNHSFGVGIYDVSVTGMTTSAVVLATAGHIASSGSMIAVDVGHDHTGAAFAGFAVTTSNGANAANDVAFHFAVLAL